MKYWSLILVLTSGTLNALELISKEEAKRALDSYELITKAIEIGPSVVLDVEYEATSKGNGGFALIDRYIRIFDVHSDTVIFKGGLLKNELVDINGDGYLDLKLNGIAVKTDEKESNAKETPVSAELIYVPSENYFKINFKSDEIYISPRI